jgi:hypothetical protein
MKGVLDVDTNLVVLLVVGSASSSYISRHKRLGEYAVDDFEMLGLILLGLSEIFLLPHAVAEASNFARMIHLPARVKVQAALQTLTATFTKLPILRVDRIERSAFHDIGLTDAVRS